MIKQQNLKVAEACLRYGVGKTSLYQLMKAGAFKVVKFRNRTLIDLQSADAFFAELPPAKFPMKPQAANRGSGK